MRTFVIMLSLQLGGGLCMIPVLPSLVGLIPAVVLLLLCGTASVECGRMLNNACASWEQAYQGHNNLKTYADLGRATFGTFAAVSFQMLCLFLLWGLGGTYTLLIGEQVRELLDLKQSNYRIGVAIAFPVLLVLIILRDYTAFFLSPLAAAAAIASCATICMKAYEDLTEDTFEHIELSKDFWVKSNGASISNMGATTSVLLGCFGIHNIVPQLRNDMYNKEHFFKAWLGSHITAGVIFLCIMVLSHLAWGDRIEDELVRLLSRQGYSPLEARVYSSSVIMNMLISYPIVQVFLFDSMYCFELVVRLAPRDSWTAYLLRILVVVLNTVLACIWKDYQVIFQFISCAVLPFSALLIPIISSERVRRKLQMGDSGRVMKALQYLWIALGAFIFVAGITHVIMRCIFGHGWDTIAD